MTRLLCMHPCRRKVMMCTDEATVQLLEGEGAIQQACRGEQPRACVSEHHG